MKLCKNCKFAKYYITELLNVCEHPEALRTTSAVNGTKEYYSCEYMRNRDFKCGYEVPKYYASKPPSLFARTVDRLLKLLGK